MRIIRIKKLNRRFFTQPTLKVAKDLLGKYIVRKIAGKTLVGKIVETEAYIGPEDRASHAYKGKLTPRNRAEWMVGGHVYIYLVYGMYWQLNISTGLEGRPECVLIRALEPIPLDRSINKHESNTNDTNKIIRAIREKISEHSWLKVANGPGKLCRWLKLDKSFYGEDVTKSRRIWLENPEPKQVLARGKVASGPRIGIDYAGRYWAKKPWRFWIKNNKFVSK